jgi:hypothetical protein
LPLALICSSPSLHCQPVIMLVLPAYMPRCVYKQPTLPNLPASLTQEDTNAESNDRHHPAEPDLLPLGGAWPNVGHEEVLHPHAAEGQ